MKSTLTFDTSNWSAPHLMQRSGSHSLTARRQGHCLVLHWALQLHPGNLSRQSLLHWQNFSQKYFDWWTKHQSRVTYAAISSISLQGPIKQQWPKMILIDYIMSFGSYRIACCHLFLYVKRNGCISDPTWTQGHSESHGLPG